MSPAGGGAEPSAAAPSEAASQAPAPAGAVDLTFWTFVDRHAVFFQQAAERWNAANPDRPITITPSVIEYNQMHDNLTAAFLSGTGAPDIVDIEIGKFANFTKGELHLLDMTAEIEPYVKDLVETRLAPYEFEGKRLAADYHLGAFLAYYNKEILDAAGVDVDSIKTWDDYIEAGKAVYDDPALRQPDPYFSNEITFDVIKSELGNVAPEYTGPRYPEIQDYFNTTLTYDVLTNGVAPADALAAAQSTIEALD